MHGRWASAWVALSSLLMALTAFRAHAVIGLTPLRVDVYARPGLPTPFQMTLINTTPTTRDVRLLVQRVSVDEDGNASLVEDVAPDDSQAFAAPEGESSGVDVRTLITVAGGGTVTLAPNESRAIDFSVNLPPDAQDEYLAMIVADPGPEAAPVRGNTTRRVNVVFRIAASVFIVAGYRQEIGRGRDTEVLLRRMKPEYYNVNISELEAFTPKPGDEKPALRVLGKLENLSTTFISPVIRARLRDVAKRRILEEVVLRHGFDMVFANTTRRFRGEFESPLEPGKYQILVDVDWGESRQATRQEIAVEVTEPIAGTRPPVSGVLQLSMKKAFISVRPGETSRGKLTLKNTFKEPMRVTPQFLEESPLASWFTFSPKTLVIAPDAERTVNVTVKADKESSLITEQVLIGMVPVTFSGSTFPDTETQVLQATVRVLPPRSAEQAAGTDGASVQDGVGDE